MDDKRLKARTSLVLRIGHRLRLRRISRDSKTAVSAFLLRTARRSWLTCSRSSLNSNARPMFWRVAFAWTANVFGASRTIASARLERCLRRGPQPAYLELSALLTAFLRSSRQLRDTRFGTRTFRALDASVALLLPARDDVLRWVVHRSGNSRPDGFIGSADWIGRQMRISRGRHRMLVTKQHTDNGQTEAPMPTNIAASGPSEMPR